MANKKVFNPLVVGNFDTVRDDVADLTTRDHGSLTDLTADDHTQYTLLAGRSSGQTIYGGDTSGDKLTIGANSTAVNNARINVLDSMDLLSSDRTVTASFDHVMRVNNTYTMDYTNWTFGRIVTATGTVIGMQNPASTGMGTLFDNSFSYINSTSGTQSIFSRLFSFSSQPLITADTSAMTQSINTPFLERTRYARANGGTLAVTDFDQYTADNSANAAGTVGAGVTITTRRGFRVNDLTGSGTLTNNIGLDIESLTKGATLNYAIRTQGTTPSLFGGNITVSNPGTSAGSVATIDGSQTLTNKTVALGSNTVSGTQAQFDTAATDNNFTWANGLSGGQTLIGGTASGDNLVLQSTSNSTRGVTQTTEQLELFNRDVTFTATPTPFLYTDNTYTLNFNNSAVGAMVRWAGTIVVDNFNMTTSALSMSLFHHAGTQKNANGEARNIGNNVTFYSAPTMQADGAAVPLTNMTGYQFQPNYEVINSGTMAVTTSFGMVCAEVIRSGVTVTTRTGLRFIDYLQTGTVTTQIGVDIAALTKATTNIGIRNAAPYVSTPSATQVIDAATDTILANAESVRISNTTGSSITLTSNPIIADGQSGQQLIITSVGADNIVLTNGNNLRLPGAANLTLGQWDTLTLIWDTTDSQWIAIGNSNN